MQKFLKVASWVLAVVSLILGLMLCLNPVTDFHIASGVLLLGQGVYFLSKATGHDL